MMWVQWLQGGTVLHLATFCGNGVWASVCNHLDRTDYSGDQVWPYRRELEGKRRVVGLCRLGGWGDRDEDNHPELPICRRCLARHADAHVHLVRWLAATDPDALTLL